jgi:hypothetical protein
VVCDTTVRSLTHTHMHTLSLIHNTIAPIRLNGGNNKNKQNKQNKKSGPHVPRPRHFRPNGHMGDKSRHAQQRGKLAGRRLLSFERQHNCKDFDPNTTNVVRYHHPHKGWDEIC